MALGRALGTGELPRRAVSRLLEETGGNPLYCRAVLEEPGTEGLDRAGGALRVPRSLAGVVLLRVGSLSPAARELVAAAAVLGHRCELAAAAALAGLADPLPALGEAVAAGILAEQPGGARPDRVQPPAGAAGRLRRPEPGPAAPAAPAGGGPGGPGPGAGAPGGGGGRPGRRAGRRAGGGRPRGPPPRPDGAGGGLAGAGGGAEQRAGGGRSPPAGRAGDPGHLRRGGRGGGPCRPGRPPGRTRGAAGCWARWISSPAGPPRPRPGCRRRGRPTTRPGTRSRAARPLPGWRCCAWSRAGSRRRSNGASGRPRPAPPSRPPCATGPWACWRSPFSPTGGDLRAWPGWRSCPPPPPRCRGRTPTRSPCAAWPGTWPRT